MYSNEKRERDGERAIRDMLKPAPMWYAYHVKHAAIVTYNSARDQCAITATANLRCRSRSCYVNQSIMRSISNTRDRVLVNSSEIHLTLSRRELSCCAPATISFDKTRQDRQEGTRRTKCWAECKQFPQRLPYQIYQEFLISELSLSLSLSSSLFIYLSIYPSRI